MTLQNILNMIQVHNRPVLIILVIVLLSLVEISKIPVNPWKWISKGLKWIAKQIGNAMFSDLSNDITAINDKVDKLENRLDTIEKRTEEDKAKNKRTQLLRFYNECNRGIKHSREEFDNFFETYDDYEEIIKKQKLKNGKVDRAHSYVKNIYEKCEANHDFID